MIKNIMKNNLIKSPLNYIGGKHKLLPQILPLFPTDINMFVDMFCGGFTVGVNVTANKVVGNDKFTQLIGMLQEFKNTPIESVLSHIDKRIAEYDLNLTNVEGYNRLRADYNKTHNPLDLFVICCFSFNHQLRFNDKGECNISFGKDRSKYNNTIKKNLIEFVTKIQENKYILTNKSFEEIKIDKLSKDDLVYCDPPYLITLASYNEKGGWNEDNECKLLKTLDDISFNGTKFALSNVIEHKGKENYILKKWAEDYNIHYLNYNYSNCNYQAKDKNANSTVEVLITNY